MLTIRGRRKHWICTFLLASIGILFVAPRLQAQVQSPKPSYFEQRKQFCKETNGLAFRDPIVAACDSNYQLDQIGGQLSGVNIVLACQNYLRDNNCDDVRKGIEKESKSLLLSCSPEEICKDEVDSKLLECTINGAKMQFEAPTLALNIGTSFGLTAAGVSAGAASMMILPFLAYSSGEQAKACNADLEYKKMAVEMHNRSLFEDEKRLDIDEKNKDVLKMQCADLKAFLRNRLDAIAQKRDDKAKWSLDSETRQLPETTRTYLASLQSTRCFSRAVARDKACKALAGLVVGGVIGGGAGLGGKAASGLIRGAGSSAATAAALSQEQQTLIKNLAAREKSYSELKSGIEKDAKLSENEKSRKLNELETAQKNVQTIKENYGDLLKDVDGDTSDVVSKIAALEAKGVSRDKIRGKIQDATRNPDICVVR